MPYIDSVLDLIKSINSIPSDAMPGLAIVRPTTRFEVLTADNPDMIRTLEKQKKYTESKLEKLTSELSESELELKTQLYNKKFQNKLTQKATMEQKNLLNVMRENKIEVREILEDKGHLETSEYDYYTDQIFATDTGQFYEDAEGKLNFIPALFKNKQRKGEERLAIQQARNMGATIKPLTSRNGELLHFEGGDLRQMLGKKLYFIGQGHRSDSETSMAIANFTGYYVIPINLLQKQFYHLDCCFLPLPLDFALIYEGEYRLNARGERVLNSDGWPELIEGTETMTENSRALIRTIYPEDKLILITKSEALAYATNAALLKSMGDNRLKLLVNGEPNKGGVSEEAMISAQKKSFTQETRDKIAKATGEVMDIVEVPFRTIHGSGGSVRCTIQEVVCSKSVMFPHKGDRLFFSSNNLNREKEWELAKTGLTLFSQSAGTGKKSRSRSFSEGGQSNLSAVTFRK